MYPVDEPYTVTTHFGAPVPGSYFGKHLGTDFAVPVGRNVMACVDSTITRTGNDSDVGLFVEATGADNMFYRYLHNSSIKVSAGQRVGRGQVIALSGATGSESTGAHCHLDIRHPSVWNASFSNYVDPEKYLKGVTMVDPNQLHQLLAGLLEVNEGPGNAEFEALKGLSLQDVVSRLLSDKRFQEMLDRRSQVPPANVTKLAPGFYEV